MTEFLGSFPIVKMMSDGILDFRVAKTVEKSDDESLKNKKISDQKFETLFL